MNAYELADEYGTYAESHDWGKQAQDMLRQQADRIAELEKTQRTLINDRNRYQNHCIELLKDKNDEPDCYGDGNVYRGVRSKDSEIKTIHYTTPQIKELSDEEIEQLQAEYDIDSGLTHHSVKDFVKAILKKASEK